MKVRHSIIAGAAALFAFIAFQVHHIGADDPEDVAPAAKEEATDRTEVDNDGDANTDDGNDADVDDERVDIALPDWDLLRFLPNGDRKLTRLRISLMPKKEAPFGLGVAGEEGLDVTIEDTKVLWVMSRCLTRPLRIAYPHRGDMWEGTGWTYNFGKIEVTTSTGSYTIWACQVGFLLESDSYAPQNVFYTWGLAKLIDDRLHQHRGLRLEKDLFRRLSGESQIDSDQSIYAEIQPSAPANGDQ